MLSPRGLGGGLEGPMPEARRAGSAARHPSGPCTGWSLGWGSDFRGNWGGQRQEQRVAVTRFPAPSLRCRARLARGVFQ